MRPGFAHDMAAALIAGGVADRDDEEWFSDCVEFLTRLPEKTFAHPMAVTAAVVREELVWITGIGWTHGDDYRRRETFKAVRPLLSRIVSDYRRFKKRQLALAL